MCVCTFFYFFLGDGDRGDIGVRNRFVALFCSADITILLPSSTNTFAPAIDGVNGSTGGRNGFLRPPSKAFTFVIIPGGLRVCLIGVVIFDVDVGVFLDTIRWITKPTDIISGMQKALIFGGILSCIGCYKGYHTSRGAKGVGKATTQAVVYSLITILVSDFFISYIQQ